MSHIDMLAFEGTGGGGRDMASLEIPLNERSTPLLNGHFDSLLGDFGAIVSGVGDGFVSGRGPVALAVGLEILGEIGRKVDHGVTDAELNVVLRLTSDFVEVWRAARNKLQLQALRIAEFGHQLIAVD